MDQTAALRTPTPTQNPTQAAAPPNQTQGTAPPNQTQADPAALPPLHPKKRKTNANGVSRRSIAWDHFTRLPESESQDPIAKCNYCGQKYRCDSRNHGTTNMKHHVERYCKKYPYSLAHDPTQTVLTFTQGSNELTATSQRFNVEYCRKALAVFIIVDEQPFRVVEGDGFKYYTNALQPQFTIPSRHTVARDCYKLYLEEKDKLMKFFRSDCSRVALTTDCWTSVQNLNYLTLTAHFIDNGWNYQKRIISFSVVPNHKGETIAKHIEEVLRKWGLKNISTITMDNASSNDVAAGILKRRFKLLNGVVQDGDFFHMRCCAHILNLVVNDGLKDCHSSIAKIRHAVRFVRSSPQRLAKFKEIVELLGISSKKLVCLDVPTRWNSTYMMLEAAGHFQVAFEKLEFEDVSFTEYFGDNATPNLLDWQTARTFIRFLKIFYDATNVFSVSLHVSIHTAFHQLASIHTELKNAINGCDSVVSNMGREMKSKYDKYWGSLLKLNPLIYFGVIFDPRYKLSYVEWSFDDMYKEDPTFLAELTTYVKKSLSSMFDWYSKVYEQQNNTTQATPSAVNGVSESATPNSVGNMGRADAFKKHLVEKNSIEKKNELERYLFEPNLDGDDKFDVLIWWKHNSSRFPILSSMAKDILATPISTVASESAFSTGGRVLDPFRSCLSPEMAEALICAQNWLRPSLFQFKDLNLEDLYESSEGVVSEFAQAQNNSGGVGVSTAGSSSQSQPNIGCDLRS